jgi:terminal uridylyltransferase
VSVLFAFQNLRCLVIQHHLTSCFHFFFVSLSEPPVLPNLQRVPPSRPLAPEEVELNGHNIYFYDDVATLRQEWSSQNAENVGELLIDFFRYFSKEFSYSKDVISIRTDSGILPKDGRQWSAEVSYRTRS